MKRVKLHQSAAVRMAVLFVCLFAASTIVAFAALYIKIGLDLDEHQKSDVMEMHQAVHRALGNQSEAALSSLNGDALEDLVDEDAVYLLVNERDEFIAGNVKTVPRFDGWLQLPWNSLGYTGNNRPAGIGGVMGKWQAVPGGHLFIGSGDGEELKARDMVWEGLGLALIIAAAAGLSGGALLGMRARRRIDVISRALDAAAGGDLSVRIPLRSSGDELDQISGRINSTLDRLQSSVASLRQATTDIAHDLRSPIGRVRQRLQRASKTASSAPEYRDVVDKSVGDIDKIVDTFNALLRIAQIEGGMQKQRFTAQSLRHVLATVVDAYAAVAEDAGQTLDSDLDRLGALEVLGDKDLLSQLFANVVENAICHCPSGSRISIVAELTTIGPVVKISDNGLGIPNDEFRNVFRRFYRLEKSRTTAGSGLGLALVAAIAEVHDVKIELRDNGPGLLVVLGFPNNIASLKAMAAE